MNLHLLVLKVFKRLYTALYHALMSPLYAGTLYESLYQVYATRAPLDFIPGRLALYQVSLLSPCGLPVASRGLPWPPAASRGQAWFGLAWLGFNWLGSVAIGSIGSSVASVQICLLCGVCWCYVALVACPALAVLGAIKRVYSLEFSSALWLDLEVELEFSGLHAVVMQGFVRDFVHVFMRC